MIRTLWLWAWPEYRYRLFIIPGINGFLNHFRHKVIAPHVLIDHAVVLDQIL